MEIRSRFAPSPTGYLHIGGARTALFNWLFARHHGGKFILRIEDTDKLRSTQESTQEILKAMEWLGLDWDEGPYYQNERIEIYQRYVNTLLNEGKAYRCYCSLEEVETKKKQALKAGQKPKYDGTCRDLVRLPGNKPFVVRYKSPQEGKTVVSDLIKGRVEFENSELDDLIIQRSDGSPTYNFSVVVDDIAMAITHIIRGDDHLNNTPRQILFYQALGCPLPKFAHVSMIMGSDGTRLSKRHGATSVMKYKEMGYLSQALINYLVRLGWSFGDQEIFSTDELIKKFTLDNVGKSASIFNTEKLLWLNSHYIKEEEPDTLSRMLRPFIEDKGYKISNNGYLLGAANTLKVRSKTLFDMAEQADFYFKEEIGYPDKIAKKFFSQEATEIFKTLIDNFENLADFNEDAIEKIFQKIIDQKNIKLGKVAQPVRVALTGTTASPGIYETIIALGKEKVIKRLQLAIKFIEESN